MSADETYEEFMERREMNMELASRYTQPITLYSLDDALKPLLERIAALEARVEQFTAEPSRLPR